MSRHVKILDRAQEDIDEIFRWLADRSPAGAAAWYDALHATVERLSTDAASFAVAAEFARLNPTIRQAFFKTRRGKRYRIVFLFDDTEIRILRVRGPGQKPLRTKDIQDTEGCRSPLDVLLNSDAGPSFFAAIVFRPDVLTAHAIYNALFT